MTQIDSIQFQTRAIYPWGTIPFWKLFFHYRDKVRILKVVEVVGPAKCNLISMFRLQTKIIFLTEGPTMCLRQLKSETKLLL